MIGLTGYFSDKRSYELRQLFKDRGWKASDAVRAGIVLLLNLSPELADRLVKKEANPIKPTHPEKYDKNKVQAERGPQCSGTSKE
jgi:hypothetical protein